MSFLLSLLFAALATICISGVFLMVNDFFWGSTGSEYFIGVVMKFCIFLMWLIVVILLFTIKLPIGTGG